MATYKVVFQPANIEMQVAEGSTLMDAINEARLDVDFPCGGRGKCGKCKVKVGEQIRLACGTKVDSDMTVELLQAKRLQHNILMQAEERSVQPEPHLQKLVVQVDKPSLEDARSDLHRFKDSIGAATNITDASVSLNLLRRLPETLRSAKNQVTAVLHDQTVVGIEPLDTTGTMYGMAFDIGTTTIVGYLLDLYTGKELMVVSTLNPQTKYGADVISRITYTNQEADGLERLHSLVIEAINHLIKEAATQAKISLDSIYGVSIAANSTMHHLFVGLSPRNVAIAPYVPAVSEALVLAATELKLEINPAGQVFVLPNIAGFVGADTVAVLLATELEQSESIKLMIDIGTNGEIALGSRHKLVTCSAAAGPAFEGAQISSGMRGAVGAIDHFYFGEQLEYTVIGDVKPVGICGSALLDAVAGLVELGLVDRKGKILAPDELTNPRAISYQERLVEHDGSAAFLLVAAEATGNGKSILVTQADIRELQLAKGAMAAGIRILLEVYGVGVEAVEEVLLAGAFGNYLNPRSACMIGLIPPDLESKVRMIGNAAGTGAKLALLSASEYKRSETIARQVQFVELGSYAKFNRIFAESMYFKIKA